jgi:hypothetical protein
MPQMRAVSAFAAPAKGRFVRMPTFEPTKCRALHEWPLRLAAPQHFEVVTNAGKGLIVKDAAPCTFLH